jgi:hypothetical protein
MNYLNKTILDNHNQHWHTLRDAGFIKNLNRSVVEELEKVYNEEVDANFKVNKWCMSCVSEMIERLYLLTKYDSLPNDISHFKQSIQATEIDFSINAVLTNNFDPDNVKKELPKKRGRKSKK